MPVCDREQITETLTSFQRQFILQHELRNIVIKAAHTISASGDGAEVNCLDSILIHILICCN